MDSAAGKPFPTCALSASSCRMTRRRNSARRPCRKVPPFVPVPVRNRADGWTPLRQAEFLGYLAETGSVAEAARRVNMARETAYRLRGKPGAESFASAWDAAIGRAGRVTPPSWKVTGYELWHRAFRGTLQPLMYIGRYTGISRKSDVSALMRVLRRPDLVPAHLHEKLRQDFSARRDLSAPACKPFTPPHRSAKTPRSAGSGEAADET